jgi:acetylornithine deacetylase
VLRVTDDRAIGLGACDIKGAAACSAAAANVPEGRAAFLFSSDEEANDARCIPAFLRSDHGFTEAIIAEPTRAKPCSRHRGIVRCASTSRARPGMRSAANAMELSAVHQAMRWGVNALDQWRSRAHALRRADRAALQHRPDGRAASRAT